MHRYPEGTTANMLVFLSLNTATAYPAADTPRLGNPDSRLSLRPFSGLLFVTCHLKAETIMYKSLCLLFPLNTLCESILRAISAQEWTLRFLPLLWWCKQWCGALQVLYLISIGTETAGSKALHMFKNLYIMTHYWQDGPNISEKTSHSPVQFSQI